MYKTFVEVKSGLTVSLLLVDVVPSEQDASSGGRWAGMTARHPLAPQSDVRRGLSIRKAN